MNENFENKKSKKNTSPNEDKKKNRKKAMLFSRIKKNSIYYGTGFIFREEIYVEKIKKCTQIILHLYNLSAEV